MSSLLSVDSPTTIAETCSSKMLAFAEFHVFNSTNAFERISGRQFGSSSLKSPPNYVGVGNMNHVSPSQCILGQILKEVGILQIQPY